MLRGGTDRRHALARRLRLFAFEVFFLGTAMIGQALSGDRAAKKGGSTGGKDRLEVGRPAKRTGKAPQTVPVYDVSWPRRTSRAAHRPSRADGRHSQEPALRSVPQVGHRPAQSGRHSGAWGRLSRTASRASGSRSTVSPTSG